MKVLNQFSKAPLSEYTLPGILVFMNDGILETIIPVRLWEVPLGIFV